MAGRRGRTFEPQSEGDIGERMAHAFALFQRGARRVVLIGSDVPALAFEDVRGALESLDDQDVVIGPATDGGYYLLALKACRPRLPARGDGARDDVLTATLDRAVRLGRSVRVLRTIGDVDTVEDLAAGMGASRPCSNRETGCGKKVADRADRENRFGG